MKRIDWKLVVSIISSVPLVLIALPAAYGSAAFEGKDGIYQWPWNIAIGVGIEAAYTGIIFLAYRKSIWSFIATALVAMLTGVLYNTLHAADIYGLLGGLDATQHWLLSAAHGAPLSVLCFIYALMLHSSSDAKKQPGAIATQADLDEATMLKQQQQPVSSQPTYVYYQQPVADASTPPLFTNPNATGITHANIAPAVAVAARPVRSANRPTSISSKTGAKPKSINYARVVAATSITPDMVVLTGQELGSLKKWQPGKYAEYVTVRENAATVTTQVAS